MGKKANNRTHGRRAHKANANCDTGRRIYSAKQYAQEASDDGQAERCDRCKFWHANTDRPKARRRRR